ncbi:MAG: homoserine O-acetyltransferase [Proteobacteria bacterium]|nr:homoserine O-acetyltransferase [Pseudomonadota bacterium]
MKINNKSLAIFGPSRKEFEVGEVVFLAQEKPLKLDNGFELKNFSIAYQTYGNLNADKSNAILICHALTGDQYVASKNPVTEKDGWWNFLIGKNKPIDTEKFFVICSNVLGGCMGSEGPKQNGVKFPAITIHDMVRAQNLLVEHFGIKKLHAVIGGSAGGMQALSWSVLYPQKVNLVIPLATSYRHSPQNIAFHEVGRQAIISDPNWCEGDYLREGKYPSSGLAVARMTAHITYLSENALQRKFGRELKDNGKFEVENYLHHQGNRFVERFDPNSYLYITRAVDHFDLEKDFNGNLAEAFAEFGKKSDGKFCVISFSDDWLFPPSESRKLTQALVRSGVRVSSVTIDIKAGHDSFLVESDELKNVISGFLLEPKT